MIINTIKTKIQQGFEKAQIQCDTIKVTHSNRPELCDYQCDNAFQIANQLKTSPMEIAQKICDAIKGLPDFAKYFKNVEPCKPGFINISVSNEFINDNINTQMQSKNFGLQLANPNDLYFIDYGGPNIAKPLHVGHLRSAIVGESIKRIINFVGGKTVSDVHWGDYGLQIGQVIYGLKQENISPQNITLNDLERIYPAMSGLCKENEEIKEICAKIIKDIQDGSKEYDEYLKVIFDLSITDIKRIYKYLDVSFDMYKGESDTYPYLNMLFDKFQNEGHLQFSQGAYVIPISTPDDENNPPVVFRKSNGAYLYASTDIGSIYEREKDYHPTHMIYVADIRQELHFNSVFKASQITGLAKGVNFEFCGFGTVNGKDGKPFKTRAGSAPKLDTLFTQVKETLITEKESNKDMSQEDMDILVNAVIKFADLQNHRAKDYIFDIEKFSKIVGKTGPYILYSYLRINKMLNDLNIEPTTLTSNIYNDIDRDLRIYLLKLEQAVSKAFEFRLPSYICDYVYNLCNLSNSFYETNRLSTETNEIKKQDYITLLHHTRNVLKQLLSLLVINTPTKM